MLIHWHLNMPYTFHYWYIFINGGYLTGRSAGQEEVEEEEEEEEEVWRAGLEVVEGAEGTILAVVKVHCLVV